MNNASVTTKAGTFQRTRIYPATKCTSTPEAITVTIASSRFQPFFIASTPSSDEAHATAEPTLTSMSPEIMTSVMPQAMMPLKATARSTLRMLRSDRKFGAIKESTMNSKMTAISSPERKINCAERLPAVAIRGGASCPSPVLSIPFLHKEREQLLKLNIVRRHIRSDAPLFHHQNTVANIENFFNFRRDKQHGQSSPRQIAHQFENLLLGLNANAARRLVHHQHRRLRIEPVADDDFLLVAAA